MSDKRTIGVYDSQAEKYSELVSTTAPDADLQAFIDAVTPGGRVLDLGCGPGNSAAMMRDAGLEVSASDASAEMVRIARDTHGIDAQLARFDELTAVNLFDGIWANFSLLHAPKPEMPAHLAAIKRALKPGGIFHIGLKIGQDTARDKIGRLYSYYEEDELMGLLNEAGFTPRVPRFGAGKGLDGSMAACIIVLNDA